MNGNSSGGPETLRPFVASAARRANDHAAEQLPVDGSCGDGLMLAVQLAPARMDVKVESDKGFDFTTVPRLEGGQRFYFTRARVPSDQPRRRIRLMTAEHVASIAGWLCCASCVVREGTRTGATKSHSR